MCISLLCSDIRTTDAHIIYEEGEEEEGKVKKHKQLNASLPAAHQPATKQKDRKEKINNM